MKKTSTVWILLAVLIAVASVFVWVYWLHSNKYQFDKCVANDKTANNIRNTNVNINLVRERCAVYYPNNYGLFHKN